MEVTMITLNIRIELMSTNRDWRAERREYGGNVENAVLTLKSVPEMSQSGPAGTKHYGVWSSPSIYIGKEVSGKYYIHRINRWDDSGHVPIDKRLKNPVGWFFDSTSSESPFLDLYEFFPGVHPKNNGFGMLTYKPQIIWSGVDWSSRS